MSFGVNLKMIIDLSNFMNRRTTDRENGPLYFWVLYPPTGRKNQTKFLQKGTDNEFDNGYSEKIYEITGQEEKSHPMSQLMEKQSMRSTNISPGKFWCTNNQRDATGREEEIKNKLLDEDGDLYNDEVDGDELTDRDRLDTCTCFACSLARQLRSSSRTNPYNASEQTDEKQFHQSSLEYDHRHDWDQSFYQKINSSPNTDTSVQAPIDTEEKQLQKPKKEKIVNEASQEKSRTLPIVSDSHNSSVQDMSEEKTLWNLPSKVTHPSCPETLAQPTKASAETFVEENAKIGCQPGFTCNSTKNQERCSEKGKSIRSEDAHDKGILDNKPLTEQKHQSQNLQTDTKKYMVQLEAEEKHYSLEEDGDGPDSELSWESEIFDTMEDNEYLYDDYYSDHYTLDNKMPQNPSAVQSMLGSSGYADTGGRYSKL